MYATHTHTDTHTHTHRLLDSYHQAAKPMGIFTKRLLQRNWFSGKYERSWTNNPPSPQFDPWDSHSTLSDEPI